MESTHCLTPRTIRRRRLLRRTETIDPELESLYLNESTMISPPTTNHRRDSHIVIMGTPSQQQTRTPRRSELVQGHELIDSRSNDIFGSSLSLNERLDKAMKQDDTKKQDIPDTSLDLSTYRMVPSKMEAAFSAAEMEPLFFRQSFFEDPQPMTPEVSTPHTPPTTILMDDRSATNIKSPTSPASSVASIATSISEQVNLSLLSWPGSPCFSPKLDKRVSNNSALTFGRISLSSRSTPPLENKNTSPFRLYTSPIRDKRASNNVLARISLPSRSSPLREDTLEPSSPIINHTAHSPIIRPPTRSSLGSVKDTMAPLHQKARRSKRAMKKSGPPLPRRWTVRRSRTKCRSRWIESSQI